MADCVLVEGVGNEPVLAAVERELPGRDERQQEALALAVRAVARHRALWGLGGDGESHRAAVTASAIGHDGSFRSGGLDPDPRNARGLQQPFAAVLLVGVVIVAVANQS